MLIRRNGGFQIEYFVDFNILWLIIVSNFLFVNNNPIVSLHNENEVGNFSLALIFDIEEKYLFKISVLS